MRKTILQFSVKVFSSRRRGNSINLATSLHSIILPSERFSFSYWLIKKSTNVQHEEKAETLMWFLLKFMRVLSADFDY